MGPANEEARDGGPGGDAPPEAPAPDPTLLLEVLEGMAHQIKNPLQAISMNLEVLRMRTRKEAPGLWDDLERFAAAVDENVEVLDRRLRLLLKLGRRAPDDALETLELGGLVRDLVASLRFDEEPPVVQVSVEGDGVPARARTGYLVELLYRALAGARAGAPEDEVEVALRRDGGRATVSLPGPAPTGASGGLPGRWSALARASGGRLEEDEGRGGPGGGGLRLSLPAP